MFTLKDYENQAKQLIDEEKWHDAYKLCNDILAMDPENVVFIRLRKKVETEVKKNNQRSINHEVEKLEHLLQEKQYEQYLRQIAPLQTYAADFPIIKEKILQAKKLLDADFTQRQDQAFDEEVAVINAQSEALNFQEAILRVEQLKKLGIHSEELTKLGNKVKQHWLDSELSRNIGLLKSQKFEDIIIFLLKLKKVDPFNPKIDSLIENTKNSYKLFKIDSKKDFIFKTIEEIKTLYIKKDYDKVLILCERILEIDEKNQTVLDYQLKATNKSRRDSTKKVNKQIHLGFKEFRNTPDFPSHNYISI